MPPPALLARRPIIKFKYQHCTAGHSVVLLRWGKDYSPQDRQHLTSVSQPEVRKHVWEINVRILDSGDTDGSLGRSTAHKKDKSLCPLPLIRPFSQVTF